MIYFKVFCIFLISQIKKHTHTHAHHTNQSKTMENKSSHLGAAETNPTTNHEVVSSIPGLTQCVKDLALP